MDIFRRTDIVKDGTFFKIRRRFDGDVGTTTGKFIADVMNGVTNDNMLNGRVRVDKRTYRFLELFRDITNNDSFDRIQGHMHIRDDIADIVISRNESCKWVNVLD